MEKTGGVIEQFFDRLAVGEWLGLGALIAPEFERVGPWGDRMTGRDTYLEMMAASDAGETGVQRSSWEVHRIAYAADGHSGFARVTAHPRRGPLSEFEEVLTFMMDDEGLVSRVEVFWQTPQYAPESLTSS